MYIYNSPKELIHILSSVQEKNNLAIVGMECAAPRARWIPGPHATSRFSVSFFFSFSFKRCNTYDSSCTGIYKKEREKPINSASREYTYMCGKGGIPASRLSFFLSSRPDHHGTHSCGPPTTNASAVLSPHLALSFFFFFFLLRAVRFKSAVTTIVVYIHFFFFFFLTDL